MLVLNGGEFWLEFCEYCADEPITNAETGETIAVGTLYARAAGEPDPGITPRSTPRHREPEPDWEEMLMEQYREEAEAERLERENAPTWYELLEEFILGRNRRKVFNVRA